MITFLVEKFLNLLKKKKNNMNKKTTVFVSGKIKQATTMLICENVHAIGKSRNY